MPKATKHHITPALSRRGLAGAGAALLALAGGAVPAKATEPNPDAELIGLCAEFDVLERQCQALSGDHPVGSQAEADERAVDDRLRAGKYELLERICGLPCTTSAGVYALGNTLALYVGEVELEDGYHPGVDDRLLAALLRGITGRNDAAS